MSDNRSVVVIEYFNPGRVQFPRLHQVGIVPADCTDPGDILLAMEKQEYSDSRDAFARAIQLQNEVNSEYGVRKIVLGTLTPDRYEELTAKAFLKNRILEQPYED